MAWPGQGWDLRLDAEPKVGNRPGHPKTHSIPVYSLLVLCFEDVFYRFAHLLLVLLFISGLFWR